MFNYKTASLWLALAAVGLLPWAARAQAAGEERVAITAISPSIDTGQDYSAWLDDDPSNLVPNSWMPANFQYIDVTLKLAKTTTLSRLALFDYQGVFTAQPALIYAQSGSQRTLIGSFDGAQYNVWVDMAPSAPVTADAIVIHKFCNNIPVKIKVFGTAGTSTTPTTPTPVAATLSFGALAPKTVGDAPFALSATSTNALTPIAFASSDASVVSVALASAGIWQATVVGAGTATITATQAASSTYLAASASQTLTVQAAAPVPAPTPVPGPTTTTPSGPVTAGKIPLDPSRWYQLTNAPNTITPLFDGSTATGTTIGWGKVIPTYDAYYPLLPGEAISLESIRFYDGEGSNPSDPMTLSVITDTWQRIPVATFTGGQYNRWVGPDPSQPDNFKLSAPISNIRYLVLTASWAYPTEIELTGSYAAGSGVAAADGQALAVQKKIKFAQELGVNGFEWDVENPDAPGQIDETRLKGLKNFTGFRHYMDWQKLESTEGGYTFNPVHSGGWNYDVLYQRLKAENITVLACLKTLPDWLLNTYPGDQRELENVPVRYGKDFSDPNSYLEQAKVAFQYAARYGANAGVPASLLHVDQSTRWAGDGANEVKIGLNLVKYIECDNERDKWWKGRKAYQTGREYAANLSAFYDGHKNTMGAGVGVKNADPGMQVVMAGLAAATPDYVRGMIDWCKQYRGYRADGSVNLCWDVINYHLYSNDASTSQGGNATRGAAPEVANTAQVAQSFVQMAHQYANDMPVWVTEAGYDTNQGSPFKAIAIGSKSVLQTEADWTLRTALLYARWGVERTFFYMLTDDNAASPVQFSSSGLLNADRSAKPAADFVRQAGQLLGAYTYTGTLNNDPLVDRYEADGKTIYALVVPDEKNRTATYTLDLGPATTATIYQPTAGQAIMTATSVSAPGGKLTITVTETPQFVAAGGTPAATPTTACAGTGSIGWEQWAGAWGSLANLPLTTTANSMATLTKLESARNIGDYYGARIRGYICPPQDGSYTFRIAGDDACQLYLSADDNPVNKQLIASVSGYTSYGEWSKYSTQQAAPVTLQAGHRYYVEVQHLEITGDDFVSVAWTLPDGTTEAPIAGAHLLPFGLTASTATSFTVGAQAANALATQAADAASATAATTGLSVYPNPFTKQTTLEFALPQAGPATLEVYDVQNRLVRRLFAGSAEAGERRQFILDGASLPVGVYLVRLVTSSQVYTQKLVRVE
ncbi:PA14 domain-containing protein [Hymenobacter cheonanensis]|uniref:PA14 domain-containing protein n=1 Tax=Hymenobacter sp. CA2-7 TaxID=3063993 RepID=UPI002712833A|nr:PA14 domain-containing protein [Hymenobacter sp. CA2-7]MDO7887380.1 PA14 domain-containing protein [Hymenobacter sp. CA2-7]